MLAYNRRSLRGDSHRAMLDQARRSPGLRQAGLVSDPHKLSSGSTGAPLHGHYH
jgi:hypothetical protein